MSDQDHHDPEQNLRERIVGQIHATERGTQKTLDEEELQLLKTAVTRLEEMLSAAADTDREALKTAAARLDTLLVEISKGKDVTQGMRRRRDDPSTKE